MRIRTAALFIGAALTVSACSDNGGQPGIDRAPTSEADISMPSASAAPAEAVHQLGQPVPVVGASGNPLTITLNGVYYHPGDDSNKSENGTFAVIAYRVEAGEHPDGIPAPITGHGWVWMKDGETIATTDGAASNAPWVGRVNEPVTTRPVQPGKYQDYLETVDIPAPGGEFVYVQPGTQEQVRWQLPEQNVTKGMAPLARAMKAVGLKP